MSKPITPYRAYTLGMLKLHIVLKGQKEVQVIEGISKVAETEHILEMLNSKGDSFGAMNKSEVALWWLDS